MSKFIIRRVATGVKFDLRAANGEAVLTSEVYSAHGACLRGIASVRRNAGAAKLLDLTAEAAEKVSNPRFELYRDRAGACRFRLRSRNGQIIAVSEPYATPAGCRSGIESVRKNASGAEIEEQGEETWT